MNKTLTEIIELIKNTKKSLPQSAVSFNLNAIVKGLGLEDILDNKFEEELMPLVNGGTNGKGMFLSYLENYESEHNILKRFNKEERKKIIDKYIEISIDVGFNTISRLKIIDGNEDYLLEKLIEKEMLKKILSSDDFINKMMDAAMVKSSYDIIIRLYNYCNNNKLNYQNFPLVMMNGKIPQKEKIKILKETYKVKDVIKYTSFIKENITDLEDLDSFIEATIIQSNRIKEKDRAVVDLIRRVFIGIRGDNSSIDYSKFKNSQEFYSKYRTYITDSTILNFTNDSVSYYTRSNSVKMISEFFKKSDFETKIRISKLDKSIGDKLIGEAKDIPEDLKGDKEKEKMFIDYMLTRNGFETFYLNFGMEKTIEICNKYPEIVSGYISKSISISKKYNSWSTMQINDVISLILQFPNSIIQHKDFRISRLDQPTCSLGFPNLKGKNGGQGYGFYHNVASPILEYNTDFLQNLVRLLKSKDCSDLLKNKIYEEVLSLYEDSSYVQGDLLSNISETMANDDFMESLKNRNNSKIMNESDALDLVFNPTIKLAEDHFPDKAEEIKTNLESLRRNLSIILNV
jgi:hypothetical protein